jgi:hypothetical protein
MSKRPRERNYLAGPTGKPINHLGRLVAEEDPDLMRYYVGQERYVDRAASFLDPAVFFIGPKGVGKSAVLQMVRLLRAPDASRVISISPDDLAFSALANVNAETPVLANAGQNQYLFKSLWDYVLSVQLLKREYSQNSKVMDMLVGLFRGKDEKEARRLLGMSINDDGSAPSLTDRVLQLIREVELKGETQGLRVSGSVKVEQPDSREKQLTLLALVHSVSKTLPSLLKHPYHVLVDDLDMHWHDTPVQNAFLSGLFTSLRKLNNSTSLKFVVALRERIFKRLPLEDRDKLSDWVCRVEWDAPTIRTMIERRVGNALDCRADEVWGMVFPSGSFELLWKRTTGRPREMIRLVTQCVNCAQSSGHNRIGMDDVTTAVRLFSVSRLEDLASDLGHRYPGFDLLVRKMVGWPKEFSSTKIADLAVGVWMETEGQVQRPLPYQWAAGYQDRSLDLARILLESGVLMVKQCRKAHPEEFDPEIHTDLRDEMWFSVHPMYAPGLNCVGE